MALVFFSIFDLKMTLLIFKKIYVYYVYVHVYIYVYVYVLVLYFHNLLEIIQRLLLSRLFVCLVLFVFVCGGGGVRGGGREVPTVHLCSRDPSPCKFVRASAGMCMPG